MKETNADGQCNRVIVDSQLVLINGRLIRVGRTIQQMSDELPALISSGSLGNRMYFAEQELLSIHGQFRLTRILFADIYAGEDYIGP